MLPEQGGSSCAGVVLGACGECLESACCPALGDCAGDDGCWSCVVERETEDSCELQGQSATRAEELTACLQTECDTACNGGLDPAPPECAAVLPSSSCGACLAQACCEQVAACGANEMCVECLMGSEEACAKDESAHQLALDVWECGQTPCGETCFADPGPNPEPDSGTPACMPPAVAPSGGSCAVVGAIGSSSIYECNPVTNASCNFGSVCDRNSALGKYACFQPPADQAVCATCGTDATGWCAGGATCVKGVCARYCCTAADCGPGAVCDNGTALNGQDPVGVCLIP